MKLLKKKVNKMRNYDLYHNRMSKNLIEKTEYIIEELKNNNYSSVIDYGCADGSIIKLLADIFLNINFIGYDINKDIIEKNKKENTFNNITYINKLTDFRGENALLILSSVLHETEFNTFKIDFTVYLKDKIKGVYVRDFYLTTTKKRLQKRLQKKIVKKLFPEHYDLEMKENYFSVDWIWLDIYLMSFNYKKVFNKDYMNTYYLQTIKRLEKYTDYTHSIKIYRREK